MEPRAQRLVPFAVVGAVLFILCLAMFRLPDSYASQLERGRALSSAQAGWAYRLMAIAAIGQALYGGFAIFQIERVRKARSEDPKTASASPGELVRSLARTAAGMIILTLVYGVASFYVTGQRGGFWLFALVALAQGAWYFRQVGQVSTWLELQSPVAAESSRKGTPWHREPPDYSPPLGR